MIGGWGIFCEIALRWMPLDLTDDKSTLVQVMAWCRQATSHYLSQCWPRSLWVINSSIASYEFHSDYVSREPQWWGVRTGSQWWYVPSFHPFTRHDDPIISCHVVQLRPQLVKTWNFFSSVSTGLERQSTVFNHWACRSGGYYWDYLSWCPICKSSNCNSFEDFIYASPIPTWAAET